MKFAFQPSEKLPKLSWLAEVEKGNPSVRVVHGEGVEQGGDFFVEGAWDSQFSEGDLDQSAVLAGSGGRIRDKGVVFCSPFHTLGRLHVLRQGDSVYISNSLPFCLAASGNRLKRDYPLYYRDFYTVVNGIDKYKKLIPLKTGSLEMVYARNIIVDSAASVSLVDKPIINEFSDYNHYRGFLEETVIALHRNANSPKRRWHYKPLVTLSSGYDGTACAVLAKSIGCDKAIAFRSARKKKRFKGRLTFEFSTGDEDSGRAAAEVLGLRLIEFGRLDFRKLSTYPEADFFACGSSGEEVHFAACEEELGQKMLLTGFHGGEVWNSRKKTNSQIVRDDSGGSSLEEFRLRVGFINLPVPFLGAVQFPSILRITQSAEMRPWSVGGDYNRPLPRRIAEEAGIPRQAFALEKKPSSVLFWYSTTDGLEDIREVMAPSSFEDYEKYFRKYYRLTLSEYYYKLMHLVVKSVRGVVKIYNVFTKKIGAPHLYIYFMHEYMSPLGKNWMVINWSVEKVMERYQEALECNSENNYNAAQHSITI